MLLNRSATKEHVKCPLILPCTARRIADVAAACGAIVIYHYPKKQLSTKVDKSKKQTISLLIF